MRHFELNEFKLEFAAKHEASIVSAYKWQFDTRFRRNALGWV